MVGDSVRKSRSSGVGCMEMLKMMSKEDILEMISQELCQHCDQDFRKRLQNINKRKLGDMPMLNDKEAEYHSDFESSDTASLITKKPVKEVTSTRVRMKTPEFLFYKRKEDVSSSSFSAKTRTKSSPCRPSEKEILLNGGLSKSSLVVGNGMSVEDSENCRFERVFRRTFSYLERINGRPTNILEGLELHNGVFNIEEQNEIVQFVYKLQLIGREGKLHGRTYSEPRKWIRGKGRVTIQFGCCYNYARDKDGNPPGIVQDEEVDPLPSLFKQMIKRMVRWHVLPPSSIPDSCIVNIYEEEDCIPPHIDHHDFIRPFCTVSLLSECDILFGTSLKVLGPGEFSGPVSIPLPVGSVMIFNGNGADVAKHCIPSVPAKRKMDQSRLPYDYSHDPELLRIKPLIYSPLARPSTPNDNHQHKKLRRENSHHVRETTSEVLHVQGDVFSPKYGSYSRGTLRKIKPTRNR